MVIYKITNKINGMSYIGQTIHDFEYRYNHNGKWWINTHNAKLRNSAKKHGKDRFLVEILRDNVKTLDELNRSEKLYIKKFNTLYPNGYNFCIGGKSRMMPDVSKDKNARTKRNGETYKIKSPQGDIQEFENCKRFCRENNLNEKNLQAVIHGKSKQHLGWTLPETTLDRKQFINPNGEKFTVLEGQLKPFCEKYNLIRFCMQQVWNKNHKQHRGWKKL